MGGNWNLQNKVRPGVYINFKSTQDTELIGSKGIVTMPLVLNWGAEKTVLEITPDNVFDVLGYNLSDTSTLLAVKEAFKRAIKVLVYRVNDGGVKAAITVGNLTATAKNTGTRGNVIKIVVRTNADNAAKKDVLTYVDNVLVDEQLALTDAVASIANNDFVVFSGTGVLTNSAGATLTGGTNGTAVTADYSDYLSAIESNVFDTMAIPTTDSAVHAIVKSFVVDMRDNKGIKIQAVIPDYAGDHEGIISNKNGVVLTDGTTVDKANATGWIAGATASAEANEALTYLVYDGSNGVDVVYVNDDIESYLTAGYLVFTPAKLGGAKVEQDINTLITLAPDKNKTFKKNRVIRVLDEINNGITAIFETFYIGKVSNNSVGRDLLKTEIVDFIQNLENISAVEDFNSSDVEVLAGTDSDSVVVNIAIKPVDSIEKIYMTVEVSE